MKQHYYIYIVSKNSTKNYSSNSFPISIEIYIRFFRAYPSIRGTSVRILLITSSLCWCVTGADCRSNGRQSPPRRRAATRSKMGANTRHLLRGLSSLRSLLLPLLGESSHGGGSRTVPLHGATSGSSVRHVVWNGNAPSKLYIVTRVLSFRSCSHFYTRNLDLLQAK